MVEKSGPSTGTARRNTVDHAELQTVLISLTFRTHLEPAEMATGPLAPNLALPGNHGPIPPQPPKSWTATGRKTSI